MKKIALPHEGLDTLYGAHDANLKHIESLLNVEIRTQGDELIVEGDRGDEQRVERLFDQLTALMQSGYELGGSDVKTAAELVVGQEAELPVEDRVVVGDPGFELHAAAELFAVRARSRSTPARA